MPFSDSYGAMRSTLDAGESDRVTYGGAPAARLTYRTEPDPAKTFTPQFIRNFSKAYWDYHHPVHTRKDTPS